MQNNSYITEIITWYSICAFQVILEKKICLNSQESWGRCCYYWPHFFVRFSYGNLGYRVGDKLEKVQVQNDYQQTQRKYADKQRKINLKI